MVLNKSQLQAALRLAGIPFPDTATVVQLRALYDGAIASHSSSTPIVEIQTASVSAAAGSSTLLATSAAQEQARPSGTSATSATNLPSVLGSSNSEALTSSDVESTDEIAAPVNSNGGENADNSAAVLAQLLREKQILELRKAIQGLRNEIPESRERDAPFHRSLNRIEFEDIENAVNKFTGDNAYGVRKWLTDFEEVVDAYETDARFRYMAARRLLDGTAKIFLRTKNLPDWPTLRAAPIKRFDRPMSGMEVREQLSRRTKRSDETYQRYVSCMEEIASQCDGIAEAEVIEAIIYGLRDHSGRATLLDTATTIEELVALLPRYEKRRNIATTSAAAKTTPQTASSSGRKPKSEKDEKTRCYNCSKFGHVSSECKEPKTPPGACFSCHSTAHRYSDCPKRQTVNAVVDENEPSEDDGNADSSDAIDAYQSVSVAFKRVQTSDWTNLTVCNSLFDTGSPISMIERSKLPAFLQTNEMTYSNFRGLGGTKLFTYGKLECSITFRQQSELLSLFVIADGILPASVLLGRDFLAKFNIHLVQQKPTIDTIDIVIAKSRQFIKNKVNKCPMQTHTRVCPINCSSFSELHEFQPSTSVHSLPLSDSIQVNTILNEFVSTDVIVSEPCCSVDPAAADEFLLSDFGDIASVYPEYSDPLHHILIDSDSSLQPLNAEWYKASKFSQYLEEPLICSVSADGALSSFDTGPQLTSAEKGHLISVLTEAYAPPTEFQSRSSDMQMKIRLTSDVPFHYAPRPLSYAGKQAADKKVDDWLQQGIIRPRSSPYASPIVLVSKKSGDIRMCVD